MEVKGVLLMAYGSPLNLDDVERYYTDIRRGRKPSDKEIEELKERYKKIGGISPLYNITFNLARKLQNELPTNYKIYVGFKHSMPFIYEVVEKMFMDNIKNAIGIVLAPHYSRMSVEEYFELARKGFEKYNMRLIEIKNWHMEKELLELWSNLIKEKFKENMFVIFSAHSLPERILTWNDPYVYQLKEMANYLANSNNIKNWTFAFQSAGKTSEKWLGPDILDVLEDVKNKGFKSILIAPIGFLCDHLEVLYDIDIECFEKGKELGLEIYRTSMPDDRDELIMLLKRIIMENL
jgi:ferrochelatase